MILPDWGSVATAAQEESLPVAREWAVDFARGALALRGGEPYRVEGAQAVRVWVRLALDPRCERFRFSAHSHDYGNELAALLGRGGDAGIRESLLRRAVTDALAQNPYITGVDGFSFTQTGSAAVLRCRVHTVYETMETEVELA